MGINPISDQIRINYVPYLSVLYCNFLLRAFSIKLRLILGQFWNAFKMESFGTTVCWTTINQNSNSPQGLLTLSLKEPSLLSGGAGEWISPGGKKFCFLMQSLNQ